jgi:lipopolysaccharide export system protein LptC
MNRGSALIDRLVSWSPVLLLGSLAALTYWLDAQVQPESARHDGTARHDADFFIENFRAVSFDADGRMRQSLAARHAEHHPDDDSVDLVSPELALTDPGRPGMSIVADAGTVFGDRETVTFRGSVRAVRDAPPAGMPVGNGPQGKATLTAEFLRVIPKQGRAETDGPVTIEEPRGTIHGVGMVFDNRAGTIRLKSGIHGTLLPGSSLK